VDAIVVAKPFSSSEALDARATGSFHSRGFGAWVDKHRAEYLLIGSTNFAKLGHNNTVGWMVNTLLSTCLPVRMA
jgi:hypothetical protein